MAEGTKYHPLFEHLLFSGQGQKTMTFAEIEEVIEAPLPPSAGMREEWWSNSPSGHSQARAWMRAGYRALGVDLTNKCVTFTLEGWPEKYVEPTSFRRLAEKHSGVAETSQASLDKPSNSHGREHPLFGIWIGKAKLVPGYDYTTPAFDHDGTP